MANSDPFAALADTFRAEFAKHTATALDGVPAELGTITPSGLKLDNFKHEIQDYLVADYLVTLHLPAFHLIGTTAAPVDSAGNATGAASQRMRFEFEPSQIAKVRVNQAAGLMPGERVVVLPVNGGADFVVMSRVVNGGG